MNKYQAILKHILPSIEILEVVDKENWAVTVTYKDYQDRFKLAVVQLSIEVSTLPEILKNYILYHEYAHILNNILNKNIQDSHGKEYQEILENLLPTYKVFEHLLKELS
jgi:predicted metal-dependent hydrolase